MQLRYYQTEAISALYKHLQEREDNPCIVLPTGSGKTPAIATICRDAVENWNGRVLILAHVKELLQQAVDKLTVIAPKLNVGIYSAGLGQRQTLAPVIVAGIQSVYQKAGDLGRFDLVLVDEAHLIPGDGDGMYQKFLADLKAINPELRIVGLTATPFRLGQGLICGPDKLLNHICYEIGVKELIAQGFLCKLTSKAAQAKIDTSNLHLRNGEFNSDEVQALVQNTDVVQLAVKEVMAKTADRKSILIFAAGVVHGQQIATILSAENQSVDQVYGDTPNGRRDEIIEDFKAGKIRYLVNVGVLTTGFDAPNVDCVVLLRPTMSAGLYYQMLGRGFRLYPEKSDCLILDFGENIVRHGPIDAIQIKSKKGGTREAPGKECPECQTVCAAARSMCPQCNYEFPRKEVERNLHGSEAHNGGILSGDVTEETYDVLEEHYYLHEKRNAPDAKKTMRVEYKLSLAKYQSEWICIEHDGFAGNKARKWWEARAVDCPFPDSAEEAARLGEAGNLCYTRKITVKKTAGNKFDEIIGYELGWSRQGEQVQLPNGNLEGVAVDSVPLDDEVPF